MKTLMILGWVVCSLFIPPVSVQAQAQTDSIPREGSYSLGMYYSQSRLDPKAQKMPGAGIGVIINSLRNGFEGDAGFWLFDDQQKIAVVKLGWRQELPKPLPNNFWVVAGAGYGLHMVPLYPSQSGAIGELLLRKDFETWGRAIFALDLGVSYFYGRGGDHFPIAVARLEIRGMPLPF